MPPVGLSPRESLLAERLEQLYLSYGPETAASDPIVFLARYDRPEDREAAGWIATAFAYGRVETIQQHVGGILDALGTRPAEALAGIPDIPRFVRERLPHFRHRFHSGADLAVLLHVIARAADRPGGIRSFFEAEFRPEERDVAGLLSRVVARISSFDYRPVLGRRGLPEGSPVGFFFPDPASGSACKRWNLYLRWMVRRDRLDYGQWTGIPTDRLVIPTDTHIHLISRRLRLTRRRTADWKTAREITDSLARFDPNDPVRFDYALCRIGIFGICQRDLRRSRCEECLASAACPVGLRRAGRSMSKLAAAPGNGARSLPAPV
jgi:uncharacterized protein (TIGR02757 family)